MIVLTRFVQNLFWSGASRWETTECLLLPSLEMEVFLPTVVFISTICCSIFGGFPLNISAFLGICCAEPCTVCRIWNTTREKVPLNQSAIWPIDLDSSIMSSIITSPDAHHCKLHRGIFCKNRLHVDCFSSCYSENLESESAFGNVRACSVVVIVELTTSWALIDGTSWTIVVGIRRIITCAVATSSSVSVDVSAGWEIVVIGVVWIGAVMTLHVSTIATHITVLVANRRVCLSAVGTIQTIVVCAVTIVRRWSARTTIVVLSHCGKRCANK